MIFPFSLVPLSLLLCHCPVTALPLLVHDVVSCHWRRMTTAAIFYMAGTAADRVDVTAVTLCVVDYVRGGE
jgi:hypothetical protein